MKIKKEKIASLSVFTGLFLTIIKLLAGILTSSLGLISEALHSFLDLGAAIFAFISIKISSRPPDQRHKFGHGKAENLSALFQAILLFITCLWIIWEAVERIFFKAVEVKANEVAFFVAIISMVFSYLISKLLKKGAIYYESQALEADALHYKSDVYTSFVVLVGLIFTKFGFPLFDSISAIAVSIFIGFLTFKLVSKAIGDLMDIYPQELESFVYETLKEFKEIKEVENLRIRRSGSTIFIELTLKTDALSSIIETHNLSEAIEEKLKNKFKKADVITHFHPKESDEDLLEKIKKISKNFKEIENIHNIQIFKDEEKGKFVLCLHCVLKTDIDLEKSHNILDDFEKKIKENLPEIYEIHSHIEVVEREKEGKVIKISKEKIGEIERDLLCISDIINLHDIVLYEQAGEYSLSCHIILNKDLKMEEAHKISIYAEGIIRKHIEKLKNVIIHTEPGL